MPGCSLALFILQLVMLTPLDEFDASLPMQVRMPEVYVDDGTLLIIAKAGELVKVTVQAARGLFNAFGQAGLPVSKTKTRVAASSTGLAKDIAGRLRSIGCKAARVMPVLGVNTAAGRGGIHGGQRERFTAMGKRANRLKRLRKAGAKVANVARAAVVKGTTYGSKVIGLVPSVLHLLRRTKTMVQPERSTSASTTMQYMVHEREDADPTFEAVEAPLRFWTRLAFDGDSKTHQEMQKAWLKQTPKLGFSKRPWQKVAGPAGATAMSLKRLGWKSSSAFAWQTQDGTILDIRADAPSSISKLVKTATEKMLWAEWAASDTAKRESFIRDPEGYWMPAVRGLCNGSKKDWTSLNSGCLASIVCGSQWPQQRLFAAGFVDTSDCQACSGLHDGTVNHRTWKCRALHSLRELGISKALREKSGREPRRRPQPSIVEPRPHAEILAAEGDPHRQAHPGVVEGRR